ncbi:MAG: T9SS type A sorting domain-containing protein [Crocinitomicaceae bacterium]|nr:T9SS type A sorting domain-containing protein [Crocinitomicaceae bacterium]
MLRKTNIDQKLTLIFKYKLWRKDVRFLAPEHSTQQDSNLPLSSSFNPNQHFPNPSGGRVTIKSELVKRGDILCIYSMLGVLLDKKVLNKNGTTDISSLIGKYNLVLVQWYSDGEILGTRKLLLK